MRICPINLIVAGFLCSISCRLVAAQSISGVSPLVLDAANVSLLTINGTDLTSYDTFSIQHAGAPAVPLQIITQSGTSVQCMANLAAERVGNYALTASGPSTATVTVTNAFELTRPFWVILSRPTVVGKSYPFTSGFLHTNTQVLLLQSDIGGAGTVSGVKMFVQSGAPSVSGTLTLRMKHTALTAFPSDQLDNSGWTDVYTGALPAANGSGEVLVAFDNTFNFDGSQNVILSVVLDATAATAGSWITSFDTGANRLIAGRSNSSSPPATQWTGTIPATRATQTEIPKLQFYFLSQVLGSQFSTPSQTVQTGVPLAFTNQSVVAGFVSSAWDFDGDGVTDSTAASPSHSWGTPGLYTVELVTKLDYAEDAETKISYISVQATSVDWELVEME